MTTGAFTAEIRQNDRTGIALICGAMAVFAVQDVLVKLLSDEISLWQLQVVRAAAVVVMLVATAIFSGRVLLLGPGPMIWPLVRAGFMTMAYVLFYASLPVLSLSQAAATFFLGPILIMLLGWATMGERLGVRRVGAAVLGFGGVLLIIRPWQDAWEPWALLPLVAAMSYATGVVITRWRCRDRSGMALTLMHNLVFIVVGAVALIVIPVLPLTPETRAAAPFVLTGWMPLGAATLVVALMTAVTHLTGALANVWAYQRDEAGRLAPFEYTYLAFIPVFDIALWGTVPDPLTIGGMVLIAAGGIVIAARDGQRPRPTANPPRRIPWTEAAEGGKKDG